MYLADAAETEGLGARLAAALVEHAGPGAPVIASIHLIGQLGAGKTTLVRGLARALGVEGPIKSPTYTLVEPYSAGPNTLYHFDLYRIGDSEELDFIGIDELMDADALKLIEWAERGAARLPAPDVTIRLSLEGEGRHVEVSVNS